MELASNFCFSVLFFLDDVNISVVVIILEDHIVSSLEARHKILSPFSRQEKKNYGMCKVPQLSCTLIQRYHIGWSKQRFSIHHCMQQEDYKILFAILCQKVEGFVVVSDIQSPIVT